MKSADIVYFAGEPVSFGLGLCHQLHRHQMCNSAIAIPCDYDLALDVLRKSESDCIVFLSPHAVGEFLRARYDELRAIGKPLLGYVSEWVFNDDVFPEKREFQLERDWFDYCAAAHSSDVDWLRGLGLKCDMAPPMFASDLFPRPPAWYPRWQALCYIGHNNAWKTERIRILQALDKAKLVKAFAADRTLEGAAGVAAMFQAHAACLCPPAHGRGQSIRCYEVAASGSLIVECQPLDPGNEYFVDGVHRVSFPTGLPEDELCDFVRGLLSDLERHKHIAEAGAELAHREFAAQVGFARFLQNAERSLTEGK
jgi:hypothetical protein